VSGIPQLTAALADRYRIERELGAGGMATVYLAEDLKHDRRVAVKVLRPELAAAIGAERFLAEIRTTAALQHPHILPLFDSGIADGLLFYVMPFVSGETVRDRLSREKQLPVADAIRIAAEVASALDYAHRHGVIHRDIKPENILLHDGSALVADFGIALAASKAGGSRMTETGMSLGTPHYMSPEQAMGEREITARSDVYALGCVLYEMLLGEPPFTGPTAQAIVAKVLSEKPGGIIARRDRVPPGVEDAVLTALEKLPADRFATAAEFARAIGEDGPTTTRRPAGPGGPGSRSRTGTLLPWAIALVATGIAAWAWLRPAAAPPPTVRFPLVTPGVGRPVAGANNIALSADGKTVAYYGLGERGTFQLFIRRLDQETPTPIPDTDRATFPFFSPDGTMLAFAARGKLWKVALAGGGQPIEILPVEDFAGGAWHADGRLALSMGGKLYLARASGGTPEVLAAPDPSARIAYHAAPSWTPDGRAVVTTARWAGGESFLTVVTVADRRVNRLALPGRVGFVVRGRWLAYVDGGGRLFRVGFDPRTFAVSGEPERIAEGVALNLLTTIASVAPNGTVAYLRSAGPRELVLVGRDGRVEAVPVPPAVWRHPRFSPDGRRMAIGATVRGARGDIWVWDLGTRQLSRLTFDSLGAHPVWSPDGRHVYYSRLVAGNGGIGRVRSDGSAVAESLLAWPRNIWEMELTPDGRTMLFRDDNPTTNRDIYQAPADSLTKAETLLGSPLDERAIAIAPDGKYFAYVSNASGADEVYLRRTAAESPTWPVTTGGATEPRWSRSGRELFFRRGDSLYAIPVAFGAEPVVGQARALFGGRYESNVYHAYYDVAPDGQHFMMVRPQGAETGLVIHLVLNWFDQPSSPRRSGAPPS